MSETTTRRINYAAGSIQSVLCIGLVVWLVSLESRKQTTVENISFPIGEYNMPIGDGRDHGSVTLSPILIGLIIFTAVTAMVHLLVYTSATYQNENVDRGQNWVRWMEYAITATIMAVVIALTCGTNSTDSLILIAVATACCMICGYISERTALTDRPVSRAATGIGWLLMMTVFGLIIRRFSSIYSQTTAATGVGPPAFVWVIVVSMSILFLSFGIIHLVHMAKQWRSTDDDPVPSQTHRRVEYVYTLTSMLAKALLVMSLGSGLLARSIEIESS